MAPSLRWRTPQDTDFSGTWTLDRDASDLPQGRFGDGGGGSGRRGPGGGMRMGAAAIVVITQSDGELAIEQQGERGSRTITYRLDGNETTNAGPRGDMTTASRWDGAALVTTGSQQFSTPRGDFTMEITQRRMLSDDSQTMTVEATRTTPRGDITMTLVYDKSTT